MNVKNINRFLTLILLFILGMGQAQAQKKSLTDVFSLKLRNIGPILEDKVVKGYYLFYKKEKLDRKTNVFLLSILDPELNEVSKEEIIGSKFLYLLEGTFNEELIMLKFYDYKSKDVEFKYVGKNGQILKNFMVETGKYEQMSYNNRYSTDELADQAVHSIKGAGFLDYRFKKEKKYGYQIDYYENLGSRATWKTLPNPADKMVEFATHLGSNDKYILVNLIKKKSILVGKVENYLMALDIKTGKKAFETKLETPKYVIQAMQATFEGDKIQVYGLYFNPDDNVVKDPSLGFCTLDLDAKGSISNLKLVSWEKDVTELLPVKSKGRLEGIGFVNFHTIHKAADGNIFLIGEQFKKAASAAGIAVTMLGGSASLVKIVVDDLMIFELNPDFKLQNIHVFEKDRTSIELPQGAGLYGTKFLANYVKLYDGFDYSYNQVHEDNEIFSVCFADFKKDKGAKARWVFGACTYSDGKFTLDQFDLKTEATKLVTLPAKPGYVMIAEYSKKEKKLDMRIEQINY